jgi:hypothetical protein
VTAESAAYKNIEARVYNTLCDEIICRNVLSRNYAAETLREEE